MKTNALYFASLALLLVYSLSNPAGAYASGEESPAAAAIREGNLEKAERLILEAGNALKAKDSMEAFILLHREAGRVARRAMAYRWAMGQFGAAFEEQLWRQPQNEAEWEALGRLYVDVAYTYEQKFEDYRQAEAFAHKALDIFVGRLNKEGLYTAKFIYRPLGNAYTRFGDFESAEFYLNKVREICLAEENLSEAANAYSDLGVMYATKLDMEAARNAYLTGMSLDGLDPISLGTLQGNFAGFLFRSGDRALTLEYTRRAEQSLDPFRNAPRYGYVKNYLAHIYKNKGEVLRAQARYEQAEKEFGAAEELFLQLFPSGKTRALAKLYHSWAGLHLEKGAYEAAIALYQKSFNCVLPQFSPSSWKDNPDEEHFFAENSIMEGLYGKASALQDWYAAEGGLEKLEAALDCHRLIFEVEHLLRQTYYYESSKLFNVEESRARSSDALEIALELWAQSGGPAYKEEALAFAERTKSILMLEAFYKTRAESLANIPEEMLREEKNFQIEITLKEKDLFEGRSYGAPPEAIQKMEAELQLLKKNYKAWIVGLEEKHPDYYRLKYDVQTLSSAEIRRQLLDRGHAFIEYFTGTERVYAFVITESRFEIVTIEKDFELEKWVTGLHNDIAQFQYPSDKERLCADYSEAAYRLYDKLVRPLEEVGLPEHLTIVPSGVLSLLPFDALLTAPSEGCHFEQYPYLIHRYDISYGYSAALQAAVRLSPRRSQTDRPGGNYRFVGFAPAFNGNGGHEQLQYNIRLLEAVQQLVGGNLFTDTEATVARLQEIAAEAGLLHFSSHAQANTQAGDFSFIVFSDGKGGYDSLFVKDIYLLPLQAEMVVLSACETAVGTLYDGEGIISLARGFLYAGANSVITTLWSINDEANSRLMEAYYRFLKQGHTKSEALRLAKLGQIEQNGRLHAHPVYWAAFTPIGNMQAVYGSLWVKLAVGGLALVFLSGLFLLWKRRKGRNTAPGANVRQVVGEVTEPQTSR